MGRKTTAKFKTLGRIRSIKPELWFDYELAQLPLDARYAFIALFCHADRDGRLEDNPERLKALIYPYDGRLVMDKILNRLTKKPFVIRYEVNSKRYIQIAKWEEHQYIHHTEAESKIPPCNGDATVISPLSNGTMTEKKVTPGGMVLPLPLSLSLKELYREYVYLSKDQYTQLCEHMGRENVDSYIDRLNDYIGAKGKKYNSHYHVLRAWWRRDHPDVTHKDAPAYHRREL